MSLNDSVMELSNDFNYNNNYLNILKKSAGVVTNLLKTTPFF